MYHVIQSPNMKEMGDILNRLGQIKFSSELNLIVGIANGGIVPAYLLHTYLGLPMELLWINFRDETHKPKTAAPFQTKPLNFNPEGKDILLADDRSNTGATLRLAAKLLKGAARVSTLVVNGKADYSLFDEDCFAMPWNFTSPRGSQFPKYPSRSLLPAKKPLQV